MRGARNPLIVLLLPVLIVACDAGDRDAAQVGVDPATETAAPVDRSAVESEIQQVRTAWMDAARAGNTAGVASLYAEDAVMVGPDGDVAEGRQAIQDALTFEGMTSIDISRTDIEVGPEIASEMGTFRQTIQTADGQEQTLTGRYLVVLRRQEDGSWRITQHLAALPAPTPQPPGT